MSYNNLIDFKTEFEEKKKDSSNNIKLTNVPMKIGIILQSNNPEHVWNTFRFANTSLTAGHTVELILMSEGVEVEDLADTEEFDISNKIAEFKDLKGTLLACGTCLKIRSKGEAKTCPTTTMTDMLKLVETSDKVLVFG